jgi:hypothetical protein
MPSFPCRPLVALVLTALAAAGCSSSKNKAAYADKVEGTLTLDGQTPLAFVRVQFVPQDSAGGQQVIASGVTDEKGVFSLKRDDTGKPGAALGKHKVLLVAGRPGGPRSRDDDAPPPAPPATIPAEYARIASTPLEVEVKADQAEYNLKLR